VSSAYSAEMVAILISFNSTFVSPHPTIN